MIFKPQTILNVKGLSHHSEETTERWRAWAKSHGWDYPTMPDPPEELIVREATLNPLACIHRGSEIASVPCPVCTDKTRTVPIFGCELHGSCTLERGEVYHDGRLVKGCSRCHDKRVESPKSSPASQRHPVARDNFLWAVGITTAPRKSPTLGQTIRTLMRAGWSTPYIFAEPMELGYSPFIIKRPTTIAEPHFGKVEGRYGAWRNFVQSMADLLRDQPNANAIALFQDDVILSRDLREYLEHDLWPSPDTGVVSLVTSSSYEATKQRGLVHLKSVKNLAGAWGLVFPREVAEKILKLPISKEWQGWYNKTIKDPAKKKGVDTFVSRAVNQLGLKIFAYVPSVGQHDAKHSTLGHGSTDSMANRKSRTFRGEDTSPFGLHPKPWIRYSLPSKDQRFTPEPTNYIKPINVVIPACECEDLTLKCLDHLADFGGVPMRVVYVDNGSKSATVNRVFLHGERRGLEMEIIRNKANEGFTRAINQGLEVSSGRHVLLLNNDCFVGPNCIPNLLKHVEWHPKTACAGPLTGDDGHQSLFRHAKRRNLAKAKLTNRYDPVSGAKACQRCYVTPEPMLAFFCTLLNRWAIADIGHLPTDAKFRSGLRADDIWCERARKKGWRNLLCYDAFAAHLHKQSFKRLGIDRAKLLKESR